MAIRKIWLIPIVIIVFLIIVAFVPQVREPIVAWFAQNAPGAYAWAAGVWGGVVANPVYQQFHVLIWFVGGAVFVVGIYELYVHDKIPLVHPKGKEDQPPQMKEPQTIIIPDRPKVTGTGAQEVPTTQEQK